MKTARADSEFDVKYVTDLIAQARKQLSSFAFAKSSRESQYYFQAMGCNEGLYTSIQLVMLDKDGNGEIDEEELLKFEEIGNALVASYLNYFTSDGVVTALILSILWPLSMEEIPDVGFEPTNGTAATAGSAMSTEVSLQVASYVTIQVAVTCAIFTLSYLAGFYLMLTFWMPTLKTQLWLIAKIQPFVPILVTAKTISLLSGVLSMFLSGLAKGGWVGYFGLLPLLGALVPFLHLYVHLPRFIVTPHLKQYARELLSKSMGHGQGA